MSKTTKKASADKQQDRSDVQSLLTVIKRLFDTSQEVLNMHTQTALILSLTIEAQMLLMKLQVMKQRWQYHLPFKEACRVRFDYWSKIVERMAVCLSPTDESDSSADTLSEYCPSKHFLLDLYETLPEVCSVPGYTPTYNELNVNKFVSAQDRIRKQMTKIWRSYYERRFSDYVVSKVENKIGTSLSLLSEYDSDIFSSCHDTLWELSAILGELHALSNNEFEPEQFSRLAERVTSETEYGGKKAEESARNDVHVWKNKTPRKRREKTLRDEIETSVNIIREMKYGSMIAEYIGEECDIKDHLADFGQYLHNVRRDISIDELNDLLEQLYRIRYFKEAKEKQDCPQQYTSPSVPQPSATITHSSDKKTEPLVFRRPELPDFFENSIVDNIDATELFYDILHRIACQIEGLPNTAADKTDSHLSKKWRWNHVRKACEKLKLINAGTPKQHFAEFLHAVFPFLKVSTITKGFQRYPETADGFDKIVDDIIYEFKDLDD